MVNDASGKWIGKVEALPDNRYRLTVRRAFQNPLTGGLKPGQVFVMPFRYDDTKPLFLHEGAYCTFRKIRVTKAPNLVFAPHWVTGFNLIECEIVPEEGAYLSSNGDASHFGINTVNGIGPYLARCRVRRRRRRFGECLRHGVSAVRQRCGGGHRTLGADGYADDAGRSGPPARSGGSRSA